MATGKTGGDVDAYCSKCKLVLAHIITAMGGSRIAKVECKTCRSVHAYRKEPAAARASTRKAKGEGRTARNNVGPSDYDQVFKDRDVSRAQRYRVSVRFAEGDVVDHPSFKLGMVTRLLADNKIEVLFPMGTKVLVHDRTAAAS